MNIILTPRLLQTVRALPPNEREIISNALTREFILGEDPQPSLTPVQGIMYAMIRFYVKQDQRAG